MTSQLKIILLACFFFQSQRRRDLMLKSSIRKGSPGAASRNVPHTRLDNENDFEQVYEYTRELGRGSFGRVYEAQCQTNGSKWAVKSVNKEKVKMYDLKVQISPVRL